MTVILSFFRQNCITEPEYHTDKINYYWFSGKRRYQFGKWMASVTSSTVRTSAY